MLTLQLKMTKLKLDRAQSSGACKQTFIRQKIAPAARVGAHEQKSRSVGATFHFNLKLLKSIC